MQKIGCGSAIKVNFIALALHYLCNEQLKPFGKMRLFFLFLGFVLLLFGLYGYAIAFFIVAYILYKGTGTGGGKYRGNRYFWD